MAPICPDPTDNMQNLQHVVMPVMAWQVAELVPHYCNLKGEGLMRAAQSKLIGMVVVCERSAWPRGMCTPKVMW